MTTLRKRVAIDTNVLVALVDSHDKRHSRTVTLRNTLKVAQVALLYFDSILNETVSVLGRRAEEQSRSQQFSACFFFRTYCEDLVVPSFPRKRSWRSDSVIASCP